MQKDVVCELEQMRQFAATNATLGYEFRKKQLQVLKKAIQKYEDCIMEALYLDLHKSWEEAYTTEIRFIYSEIANTVKKLRSWMKPVSVNTPLVLFPSSSKILREPYGVCLIIAPWNYPFQLLIAPLIGSLAGGNCTVLKPSELAQILQLL